MRKTSLSRDISNVWLNRGRISSNIVSTGSRVIAKTNIDENARLTFVEYAVLQK